MTQEPMHPFETMMVAISRLTKNGENAATGTLSPIPAGALFLAQMSHAPDLVPMIYGDPELRLTDGLHEFFGLTHRGLVDLFFASGIQIDRQGSINLSVIGDFNQPKLRLPGGAGSNMLYMMAKRTILFTISHTDRLFVPQVSFINARGMDASVPWRRGGLSHVVTPMCVMRYDPIKGVLVLDATMPGVSADQVQQHTGFDLGVSGACIPEIAPVNQEDLNLLRGPVCARLRKIYPLFCDMIWGPG